MGCVADAMVRVDGRTRRPGRPIRMGAAGGILAAPGGRLRVADYRNDLVRRVNARTGAVAGLPVAAGDGPESLTAVRATSGSCSVTRESFVT